MTDRPKTMRALRIDGITPASEAQLTNVEVPQVKDGWALARVEAFGLNNSEHILRHEEIMEDYIAKPVIPGIEVAGVIVSGGSTDLLPGTRVIACMGGMGRSYDGSYAEYTLIRRSNTIVVPDDVDWSWAELGAFPETYLTAWGSLFECLQLQPGDTLLVRGATCGLGYVAIQLAKALKVRVLATTHREGKLDLLRAAGANEAILDQGPLAGSGLRADKVLDLIGPRVLLDTLRLAEHGGIVCTTGILGKVYTLNGFDPIKDIPNGVYLTGFFSNYPTQELFDALFAYMVRHRLRPLVGSTFSFDDLPAALAQQDAGSGGKIVVVHG